MLTGIPQSVVTLTMLIIFYAVDFRLIARYDHRRQAAGSGRSWDYTLLIGAFVLFMALQPALLPWAGLQITTGWGLAVQGIGLVLLLGAIVLHIWARLHLRQFYAERVEIQPGHELVDTGPYAHIRHPVFTSFFGLATGLVLINPALPTVLFAAYTWWDFSRAARAEEVLLATNLPGYADYMARTGRFLPPLLHPRKDR